MQNTPALPLLPGFAFDRNLNKTKFHKNHYFDKFGNDVYYLSDKINLVSPYNQNPSIYSTEETKSIPSWIAYDGQKLLFKAYFQETIEGNSDSSFQIRVVNISFYLEDDTIKILEPVVKNSGLQQGVLVKRQRIPVSYSDKSRFYNILDFNVGLEVEIFGKVYKIVDCDKFTRVFLNRLGIFVPDSIKIPLDPHISKLQMTPFPKKPKTNLGSFKNLLKYDRKVLRYYGYWDDSSSPYGFIHDLEIHYFLADDTIEIKEILPVNSGQDTNGIFLRRIKIPKTYTKLEPIGAESPLTVLNVMGECIRNSYLIMDPLQVSSKDFNKYYKDHELNIGSHINVFGREIVITDMDPFTREYYRTKYGIEDMQALTRPEETDEKLNKIEKDIPPYNGFGSYEDSLANCFSIIPKPHRLDFTKILSHDKQGFDSHVLRFRAKMLSCTPEYEDRLFIIRVHLMDDTISIFEQAKRNSGFVRNLFQSRRKVLIPGQNIFSNIKPKYYEPQDFYIGAQVNICGFNFQIISADIYTLRYMEINQDKFPVANITLIMCKVRDALKPVFKEFLQRYSFITKGHEDISIIEYKQLKEGLSRYLGNNIVEHEIITIARNFSFVEKKETFTREYVRRLVHTELQRNIWNELDHLEKNILHWDRGNVGYLSRDIIYKVLRGCRLPIDIELLNSLLNHIKKNEEDKLDWKDLLEFLNVNINSLPPCPPTNIKTDLWWASEKESSLVEKINWSSFLKELDFPMDDKSDTLDN